MSMDKTQIKPFENHEITLYAYTLPQVPSHQGYIKVGDTMRDVRTRIREQLRTAGLKEDLLWTRVAQKKNGEWFRDKELHAYFRLHDIPQESFGTTAREWFYFNDTPERAYQLTEEFICSDYSLSQIPDETSDYVLRKEQSEAVQKTLEYFQSGQQPAEFLWNAKPRFGKTLSAYDLARQLKAREVLIVTNRPAIANSWYEDYRKFISWQETDIKFVSNTDELVGKALTRQMFIEYLAKEFREGRELGHITFLSLQDLKGARFAGGKYDKLEWVESRNWDLLVIDEAHEGIDTYKTDRAFAKIKRNYTLHLSGTPFKALANNKFSSKQIFNWSYVDEQTAKRNWDPSDDGHNPYERMPEMRLFTYQMSKMIEEKLAQGTLIQNEENVDYAFDLSEFFRVNDKGRFEHAAAVSKFLDNLTCGNYPYAEREYKAELKHSLWMLPRVAAAKAMEQLLNQHPVFQEYKVILAAGDGISLEHESDESVEEEARNFTANEKSFARVTRAIAENEKTITLTVGQLTTGVTIPQWTAVFMLSNINSPALYFQAAFRAQNPYEFQKDGLFYRKERSYVFDFAPERTLRLFDEFANNLSSNSVGFTTDDRKKRIADLLNFFPVIGEDPAGGMKELNTEEVLTIPNRIRSQEVVKRGFMSNLLFANIANIFSAPQEIRDIIEKLHPEKNKRIEKPRPLPDLNPLVDGEGNIDIPDEIVINTTKDLFGDKIFGEVRATDIPEIANLVTKVMLQPETQQKFENLGQKFDLTKKETERVKEDFRVQITGSLEQEKANYEDTLMDLSVQYTAAVEEVDRDVFESIKKLQDDKHKAELLSQAEAQKLALQEKHEENLQTAERTYQERFENRVQEAAEEMVQARLEKREERKKNTEETDLRDHLRGFARTIPSFLMAYGNENTTLYNFEHKADAKEFEELTSITKEDFRKLRDGFNYVNENGEEKRYEGFFDEIVFNASIQEFLAKKEALSDYFDEAVQEDIFDYIPAQKTNQIFTPKPVVRRMVDFLEKENPGIFTDPDKKYLDLYTKSGLFLAEIVRRLYQGLESVIPDKTERICHIFRHQVYGVAPTQIIQNIAENFVYGEKKEEIKSRIVAHDLTPEAQRGTVQEKLYELFGDETLKFDVIIGNPPYQEEAKGTGTRDQPLYHYFMDEAFSIADKTCLITPARFLFDAGQTPKAWNRKMLDDEHLKVIEYYSSSKMVFDMVDIKGGVVITLYDKNKNYNKINVFTPHLELNSIVSKVTNSPKSIFESLSEVISSQGIYRFSDVAIRKFPQNKALSGKGTGAKIISKLIPESPQLFTTVPDNKQTDVLLLGKANYGRIKKYIKREYLQHNDYIDTYNILVPESNGTGAFDKFSTPVVAPPQFGSADTFISIGMLKTEEEALSLLKFIKTKFLRALVGVKKATQHNPKSVWQYVPMQDFTENSDIDWTKSVAEIDRQLYKKYGLTEEEIAFIEEKVQAME